MANLKIIRKRIGSVRNTQQVTKAMKMVAAAKLRRAQERAEHARAYSERLASILGRLAGGEQEGVKHPLLAAGADAPAHVIVITGDRGLCGAYNSNVVRKAEQFLTSTEGSNATVTACGRRGRDYLVLRGYKPAREHVNLAGDMGVDLAREIAGDATSRFVSGDAGKVYLVYTKFRSAISHVPTIQQLLPVEPSDEESTTETEYVYEPSGDAILASLVSRYVDTVVFHAMLEATASEHGARMTAMDSASRNAAEMLDRLTLQMNRARQASITTELMEIVGGAEALNG